MAETIANVNVQSSIQVERGKSYFEGVTTINWVEHTWVSYYNFYHGHMLSLGCMYGLQMAN